MGQDDPNWNIIDFLFFELQSGRLTGENTVPAHDLGKLPMFARASDKEYGGSEVTSDLF